MFPREKGRLTRFSLLGQTFGSQPQWDEYTKKFSRYANWQVNQKQIYVCLHLLLVVMDMKVGVQIILDIPGEEMCVWKKGGVCFCSYFLHKILSRYVPKLIGQLYFHALLDLIETTPAKSWQRPPCRAVLACDRLESQKNKIKIKKMSADDLQVSRHAQVILPNELSCAAISPTRSLPN